jgi:hypothetical protein
MKKDLRHTQPSFAGFENVKDGHQPRESRKVSKMVYFLEHLGEKWLQWHLCFSSVRLALFFLSIVL